MVLLSAIIRGSAAYEAFSDDAVKFGQHHLEDTEDGGFERTTNELAANSNTRKICFAWNVS